MADGPTRTVALMVKAEQDRKNADKRMADARKAAARELGEVVLSAGAHTLRISIIGRQYDFADPSYPPLP